MRRSGTIKNKILNFILFSVLILAGYYFIIFRAEKATLKIAETTLTKAAEDAAETAVLREVVKEEFIQYIKDKVIDEVRPAMKMQMNEVAVNASEPVDLKFTEITETLKKDIKQLDEKSDKIISSKLNVLEKENSSIKTSIEQSAKNINDFINLTLTDLVPAGAISAFYCKPNSPPAGWLVCDGKVISCNTEKKLEISSDIKYTRLVNILTALGYGTTECTAELPDLRGVFLKGIENNVSPGEYQDDSIKKHKHPIFGEAQTVGIKMGKFDNSKYRVFMTEIHDSNMPSPRTIFKDTEFQGKSTIDNADFNENGGDETIPKNVSIVWCIKY